MTPESVRLGRQLEYHTTRISVPAAASVAACRANANRVAVRFVLTAVAAAPLSITPVVFGPADWLTDAGVVTLNVINQRDELSVDRHGQIVIVPWRVQNHMADAVVVVVTEIVAPPEWK